jgi:MFS family permease
MSRKVLLALCLCNVVIYVGIGGLVGLMPVYLTRLGADATITGLFLASAYLSLALSNIAAGRLSDRFQRRKVFLILGGTMAAPVAGLMSQATSVGPLWLLMACLWFAIGIPMAMVNILTGLCSDAANRGRSFGLLSLSSGLGLFAGGLVSGRIVDRWGFPTLFALFAALCLLIPLAGIFIHDGVVQTGSAIAVPARRNIFSNRTFTLLFAASILAQAANILIFLTRPLIMEARHFDATTIGSAAAVGSLVTLPLPLLIGWLTDKIGRKAIIVACFLAPSLGLAVQAAAVHPWHFWISSLLSTVLGFSTVAGSALLADLFPAELLSRALSLLSATPWIGIVIGLSAGGTAIQVLEMMPALVLALLLSLVAILLLTPVGEPVPEHLLEMG